MRSVSQTSVQVLDGRATLTQHYDPAQMLRLMIALTAPHMDQERHLIDELHEEVSGVSPFPDRGTVMSPTGQC